MRGENGVEDLSPEEVRRGVEAGELVLVDVREPDEFADERIADAANAPLSAFDPSVWPLDGAARVVLYCKVGGRSRRAAEAARAMGVAVDAHLDGGIIAWKRAGLPTLAGAPDGETAP